MPFTENTYTISMLAANVTSTSTTVGATIDLANYFSVGKREIKFIVAPVWTSATAATAETVTVYFEELDSSASAASTVSGTALSGITTTSAAGGGTVVELNGLVSKRYIRAKAYASAASNFGVAAAALPLRRFAA